MNSAFFLKICVTLFFSIVKFAMRINIHYENSLKNWLKNIVYNSRGELSKQRSWKTYVVFLKGVCLPLANQIVWDIENLTNQEKKCKFFNL